MGKRVLVAVDTDSASEAAIVYGIELAARLKSPLSLIAISSSRSPKEITAALGDPPRGHDRWLDRAITESQEKAVNLEIFVASGRFFEEIVRFVRSQPSVRYLVMAAAKDRESKDVRAFTRALEELHREFEGEILLVEKAGEAARFSDISAQSPERKTPV